ncbi:hypothetical protein FHT40_004663 [Mycolicibacterium sp. BK556]|uniref:hypothetical protein n=1 Tax=unclassified Mycolicibacterium TaxID=2636767 RepID=UPI0016189FF0|nr:MULTISPECIES: hypothetical protein [unclassified Mycolicibacterium]MBB3604979.1 hypothetical protein [Mycolicibacterium sp. BK556]MBB3635175.1 hypothetical protein [Mycolicibacterium sp. BK607]MBB3748031.1 hypothetical protein [Mycolicibacterium sp. BK634]
MDIHFGAVGDGNSARLGPGATAFVATATGASIDEAAARDCRSLEEFRKLPVLGRFAAGDGPD